MARWSGNAGVHTGTAPRSGARRRNANREEARGRLGTPTSGRHARERETSADDAALGQLEFRTPFQSRMAQRCTPRICAVTLGPVCAMGDSSTAPFARLGRAVPAGGRCSKPSPRFCSGGDMRFRGAVAQRCRPEVGVPSRPCGSAQAAICGFAALSRSGAGRRPAFRHRLRGVTRVAHPPADDEIGRASFGRPTTGCGERKRGKGENSATWNGRNHGPYCGGQSGFPARRGFPAWRPAAVSRSVGSFRERRGSYATRRSWR